MRIVCQQTILMQYYALFEKLQKLKISSAANYRWRFMGQRAKTTKWVRYDIMVLVYLK